MQELKPEGVSFLEKSARVAGSAAGAAIGFALNNASGAALGAAIGTFLTEQINDISSRYLSEKETIRTSLATNLAAARIREHLEKGEQLREDMFVNLPDSQPKAETLFEAMLCRAKSEAEDRKIKYVSKIFANMIFDEEFSFEESIFYTKIIENMTFQQLCLLKLYSDKNNQFLRSKHYAEDLSIDPRTLNVLMETYSLFTLGLVLMVEDTNGDDTYILNFKQIMPSKMQLSDVGSRFHKLTELVEIDSVFLTDLEAALS